MSGADESGSASSAGELSAYESDVSLNLYLLFHYGTPSQILEGSRVGVPKESLSFPERTVHDLLEVDRLAKGGRALDVGCAVGRSTFELTPFASETVGIDFSERFVEAATAMRDEGLLACRRYREGHLSDRVEVERPAGLPQGEVRFEVGDAMDLRPHLGSFDVVHAANLLCRLPDPAAFLGQLPDLMNPGGQLILATPATWSEAFTPIGAMPEAETLDFLDATLGGHFERRRVEEIPFAIREHSRKFQLSTAQTSLWIRR